MLRQRDNLAEKGYGQMTALDRYVRLESDALWRADPGAQRRDVSISFGDATLVIADQTGRPLAHWSLPALIRTNPSEMPAVYTPDVDESELLEIADPTMVEAIEEVSRALARSRPRPGKLRHWLTAAVVVASLLLVVFWLPGALTRQTLAVVPFPKRVQIGAEMLADMQATTGFVCRSPRADLAANAFAQRLFGPDTTRQIIVVPDLAQGALALPGGLIVVGSKVLQLSDDPAAAAGFILASRAAVIHMDPLEALLKSAGLGVTFRLLTTGAVPAEIIQANAQALLSGAALAPDPAILRAALADAQIPQAPYIAASDRLSGNTPDLGNDPMAGRAVPLIMTDSDWVSLRNVCNQ